MSEWKNTNNFDFDWGEYNGIKDEYKNWKEQMKQQMQLGDQEWKQTMAGYWDSNINSHDLPILDRAYDVMAVKADSKPNQIIFYNDEQAFTLQQIHNSESDYVDIRVFRCFGAQSVCHASEQTLELKNVGGTDWAIGKCRDYGNFLSMSVVTVKIEDIFLNDYAKCNFPAFKNCPPRSCCTGKDFDVEANVPGMGALSMRDGSDKFDKMKNAFNSHKYALLSFPENAWKDELYQTPLHTTKIVERECFEDIMPRSDNDVRHTTFAARNLINTVFNQCPDVSAQCNRPLNYGFPAEIPEEDL